VDLLVWVSQLRGLRTSTDTINLEKLILETMELRFERIQVRICVSVLSAEGRPVWCVLCRYPENALSAVHGAGNTYHFLPEVCHVRLTLGECLCFSSRKSKLRLIEIAVKLMIVP